MDNTHDNAAQMFRFALPAPLPPFWITAAGITSDPLWQQKQEPDTVTIAYICSGTGLLLIEQNAYHPSAGDVCILAQPESWSFTPEAGQICKQIFFHIKGSAATSIVQAFGLEQQVLYQNCGALRPVFEELLAACAQDIPAEQVMGVCSMLTMELLNSLHLLAQQDPDIPADVRGIKSFIDNNVCRDLRMEDIAASVFRSNDYVKKHFKQYYGITPYAYYLELKITRAKHLLQQTNLSISQIADRLGYKSDRYFSKRFREAVGISATQFRKQSCQGKESGL